MSLQTYQKKRRFNETPEPKGAAHKKGKELTFVIQKHNATRLHYDFRLEMNGVLKSWAVPKGPSLNPVDKHLAMMVEDHPYDYRTFEGIIPEGNYGAGSVIVWDAGTYEALEPVPPGMTEEEFLLDQLAKGSLKIVMHGEKLKGEFALVRFKRAGDNGWLLIKHHDEFASETDILMNDQSVQSGRTVEEVAAGKPISKQQRAKAAAAKRTEQKKSATRSRQLKKRVSHEGTKAPMPHDVSPMLAEQADFPFDNGDWVFEMKWDGYRAVAEIHKNKVTLHSRNQISFTERYPELIEALRTIPHTVVLDGEIVVLDEQGRSRFQLLQDYRRGNHGQLIYYVFDILHLDGYDLTQLPLVERKRILETILPESSHLKFSDHISEHGLKLYEIARRKGYEGIVAKQKNSPYSFYRSTSWLKVKHIVTQEAVIAGFTKPKGSRSSFGALILAVYENGQLRYVGHAGGGFDQQKLSDVYGKLQPLITTKSPFDIEPKTNTPATWVQPKLVCQVKFTEWTNDGMMRHPVFLGLREDKKPQEVVLEQSTIHVVAPKERPVHRGKVQLSNLNKVYWPVEGFTKGNLIDYYDTMADIILPYLKDRPISLNRFPDGIEGESFFQKDMPHVPDWVKTVPVFSDKDQRNLHWLICNNRETLLYIANLGSIEVNPWNSRYTHPDHPDYLIIDLDPEGIPFSEVIKTAHCVKEIFDSADVDCFLKTSGKTGLHIFVPLRAKYDYEQAKQFAEIVANLVFARLPQTTSVVRDPKKREHKIYIDFLQNRQGQTIAAPYCVRPVPGAPVSTPLEWKELTRELKPSDFTIETIIPRVKKRGDIWEDFRKHRGINMLKALKKLTKM